MEFRVHDLVTQPYLQFFGCTRSYLMKPEVLSKRWLGSLIIAWTVERAQMGWGWVGALEWGKNAVIAPLPRCGNILNCGNVSSPLGVPQPTRALLSLFIHSQHMRKRNNARSFQPELVTCVVLVSINVHSPFLVKSDSHRLGGLKTPLLTSLLLRRSHNG